jgi:Bacterial Ig domain/HYR domain
MTKSKSGRRSIAWRLTNRRYELATLAAMSAATACANGSTAADAEKISTSKSALVTTAQGTAAAQNAIDFMIPNAIQFTQDNNCLSCHRQPDSLISASTAAQLLPGITLDTSATTGTGYIANLIINTQADDGHWSNGGGNIASMSAEALWGIAGYARANGPINVLPSIKKGLLWLVPQASSVTFPNDSSPFAGQTRTYLNNDFYDTPQMFDWYLPTAQSVYATRVLLDLDTTLGASDVSTLSAQQTSYTDALEGATMRNLAGVSVQDLALTSIAMAESGRASTADAQAIGTQLLARQTAGSGWADPVLPDGTLDVVNTLTTGQALYALCRLGFRARVNPAAGAGLDWLAAQQQDDGEWLLPTHNSSVSSSWALLAVACASNPSGTAEFNPLTANGSPEAPVTETFTTTLNVTNTSSDARTAAIAVTGGPVGAIITVTPSSLSLDGDASSPVIVSITLPAGLPVSTSYPFVASVDFTNGVASSHVSATFTTAIGATPDASLTATTTTLSNPPTRVDIGASVSLSAGVAGSDGQIVHPGTVAYSIDSQAIATVSVSGDAFPTTWTVPTLSIGSHTLHVVYSGSSGDIVFAASSVDQAVDVEPPAPPAPVVTGVADGSTSTNGVYNLSGVGTPGDTIAILANGVLVRTATVGADGTWGASFSLSPGAYALSTVETGPGGTSDPTTSNVSVQPTAPVVGGPAPGTTFTSMMQQVSGTATPGATVNVLRDGVIIGTTTAGPDGSYAVGVTLVPGPNNLTVSQTVNGQSGALSGVTYNETPSAPSIGSPSTATSSQKTTPTDVTGTTVPGATVVLTDNGVVIGSAIAGPDGSYSIPATLSSGQNSLSVTSTVGGIPGAPSHPVIIRVDGDAPFFPVAPHDVGAYAPTNDGIAVSWPAIGAYDAQDGRLTSKCNRVSGSIFTVGSTRVICSAADSMGNVALTGFNVKVTLQQLPTLDMPKEKDMIVKSAIATGASVSFNVTAKDAEGNPIAAICVPASGSFFAAGTTKVTCTASDPIAETAASSTFDVTVIPVPYYGVSAQPKTDASMSAGGGCNMSQSTGSSDLSPLVALGLAIAAASRRRKQNGVDSIK